jgi:microcin C transport system permease protein
MIWPPIRYSYRTVNNDADSRADRRRSCSTGKNCCKRYPKRAWKIRIACGQHELARHRRPGPRRAARLIYGFRISVLFGLILTAVSSVIGVAAGAVQGYFGGWTDLMFQRFIEIWTSMPTLYILLIIAAVLPPGFWILLGIMLLFSWVALVGVVRAEFLRARNFEYVGRPARWACPTARSCSATCCPTPWWRR